MACPGHRFKAHRRDRLLARLADSVGPLPYARERFVDRSQEMCFVLTQAHTQFHPGLGIRYVGEIAFHASGSRWDATRCLEAPDLPLVAEQPNRKKINCWSRKQLMPPDTSASACSSASLMNPAW